MQKKVQKMASLKLYLDIRCERKDGTFPLKMIIQNNGTVLLNLKIYLTTNQLLENKEIISGYEVVNHLDKKFLNNIIENKFIEIKHKLIILENVGKLKKIKPHELKDILEGIEDNIEEKTYLIKEHFERFTSLKSKLRTKQIYQDTLKKIESYTDIDTLSFHSINVKWLKDFESFLAKTCSINTISIHLRNLRAIFNDAINEELIEQNCYPFRKFKIRNESTKKRALSINQLREIAELECPEHMERYRDMFMLIFYLIGINLVDLLNLKNINNGYIEYRRSKTNRIYTIKVEPEAIALINKYKGENYLLNLMDRYKDYKSFTTKINKNLKKLGTIYSDAKNNQIIKPIHPELTTYYARHTWATIAASLEIPKETIAAALGHGGNSVTDIYINFDQKKIDEANRKVIDYVLNKKSSQ